MLRIARYLAETDLPKGAVSILPMDRPTGDRMVSDDRFKLLSFTGSPSVGWKMKAEAGKKKVVLELGGNAGAIVDETADLDWAVERLVYGSFAYAGQVCISVQRIYVVRDVSATATSRAVRWPRTSGPASWPWPTKPPPRPAATRRRSSTRGGVRSTCRSPRSRPWRPRA